MSCILHEEGATDKIVDDNYEKMLAVYINSKHF